MPRLDVGETSVAEILVEIFDHNNPVGAIISPSHLDYLRHFDVGRSRHKELLGALAERWWDTTNTFHFSWGLQGTDPSSSTPVEGPSRAEPSHSTGPSRAPRAVTDATGPLHPDLANLHLPYIISYHTPDGTLAFREVSLANVNRWNLPSDSINEVPDGLVSQMMELILGMEQELSSAWTLRAFDDQRRRRPRC
ncbi:hypothetical protein JCGZ_03589 [Jatropha curcas]|uniref:Aminotransferase-like plant mobile domain-containing protein n=1 Tax=Jatropha curcas TaxID=180498 RepID=A0A067JD63_JATCU|nr:hypothetical protein JCGZ_03589 [Jatropha curcas]